VELGEKFLQDAGVRDFRADQADLFDRVADRYDERVPFFRTLGRQLVEWADLGQDDAVLDIGAGRGAVSLAALEQMAESGTVQAIDVSPRMVALVNALGVPRLFATQMDAHVLCFEDNRFDMTLAGFVFTLLRDQTAVMAEVHRVLKPGASLCVSIPGPSEVDGGWWERYGEIYADFQTRLGVTVEPHTDDKDEPWEELAMRAGLCLVDERSVPTEVPLGDPGEHWDWLMSHGNSWLYDALEPGDAEQFRGAVMRSFVTHHPTGGRSIIVAPVFLRFTKTDIS